MWLLKVLNQRCAASLFLCDILPKTKSMADERSAEAGVEESRLGEEGVQNAELSHPEPGEDGLDTTPQQTHADTIKPLESPLSRTKSIEESFDDAEEDFIRMEDHTQPHTSDTNANANANEETEKDVDVTPATTVEEFDKRMSVLGLRTPPESSVSEENEEHLEHPELNENNFAKILSELAKVREDNVALMTSNEKYKQDCELIQQDLEIEKKQRIDAEEIIVQLRTRVEESRNGVMKLQQQQQEQDKSRRRQETESKRSSFILNEPVNLSVGWVLQTEFFLNDLLQKRASIKSHKRLSSMSTDNAKALKDFHLQPQQPPSNAPSNRSSQVIDMTNLQMENANLSNELQRMRKEVDALKEGKLSSENALRALREFMDSSGEEKPKGLKLPPLPTDEDVPTPTTAAHKANGSWFFGRQPSNANYTHESTSSQHSNASTHSNDGGFDKPSTLRSISNFFGKN